MDNFTDNFLSDSWVKGSSDLCEEVTNHWLYFIFAGYVLPLISPRVRDWFKETLNTLKNNKLTGEIVTLTEYGFNKIQDIEDDKEMKDFIKRICKSRRPGLVIQDKMFDKLTEMLEVEPEIRYVKSAV